MCNMNTRTEKEYIIFADESVKRGEYYSNFYGGLIVGASQHDALTQKLNSLKSSLGFHGELKWQKVTRQYLEKYEAFVDGFFDEVESGEVKIRMMFSANSEVPPRFVLQDADGYFKLYYQFIKHAFGLKYIPVNPNGSRLRLLFDEFPETGEKVAQFKGFLIGLAASTTFKQAGISLEMQDIAEVRSHNHVLMQALDIVLGAMAFRLNDKHLVKPYGEKRRGKRTIAKHKLYKKIVERVKRLRSGFNFGESTGWDGSEKNLWLHPYRHWKFIPKDATHDDSRTKGAQRKNRPSSST
jgi:Protein of unknown function (DUF3800)